MGSFQNLSGVKLNVAVLEAVSSTRRDIMLYRYSWLVYTEEKMPKRENETEKKKRQRKRERKREREKWKEKNASSHSSFPFLSLSLSLSLTFSVFFSFSVSLFRLGIFRGRKIFDTIFDCDYNYIMRLS